jgi:VHL beta domain
VGTPGRWLAHATRALGARPLRSTLDNAAALLAAAAVLFSGAAAGESPGRAVGEGPTAYTVACAIADQPRMHNCAELPSADACKHEGDLASRPSSDPTGMTFVNRSDTTLDLYWLDFQGGRRLYHHLTPGARAKQDTYIGHYWLLATPDGVCVGIFKAAPESLAFF